MITAINSDIQMKDVGIYMGDLMIHRFLVEELRKQSSSTENKAEAILLLLKKLQILLEPHFSARNSCTYSKNY